MPTAGRAWAAGVGASSPAAQRKRPEQTPGRERMEGGGRPCHCQMVVVMAVMAVMVTMHGLSLLAESEPPKSSSSSPRP